jgi:hypothetical protein
MGRKPQATVESIKPVFNLYWRCHGIDNPAIFRDAKEYTC